MFKKGKSSFHDLSIEGFLLKIFSAFARWKQKREKRKTFYEINEFSPINRMMLGMACRSAHRSYEKILKKLKCDVKSRKLNICFLVKSISKWHCGTLYDIFEKNRNFEPKILVTKASECNQYELIRFFEKKYKNVASVYSEKDDKFFGLKQFNPDIVFYQEPWGITQIQHPMFVSKYALTCYTPYCFHMMVSNYDYIFSFHRFLWAYFVESESHKSGYEKRFNAKNCIASGSTHFDRYQSKAVAVFDHWNDPLHEKKRIIYAPHFTLDASHMMSTFLDNGRFMLNLAGMYPQTTWIVKPHPMFYNYMVSNGVFSKEELDNYYAEWEQYGTIWNNSYGDYFDMFKTSDCLITDCISFLADYFFTGNPVLHLRSKHQTACFNEFGGNIINSYYQIHDNAELERTFFDVVINGNDTLSNIRSDKLQHLLSKGEISAGKSIVQYINRELGIE